MEKKEKENPPLEAWAEKPVGRGGREEVDSQP